MVQEYEEGIPGAVYPKEMDTLLSDSQYEQTLWEIFEPIWRDIRSSMSPSILGSVLSYCELFKVDSMSERQFILDLVTSCLPTVKKE